MLAMLIISRILSANMSWTACRAGLPGEEHDLSLHNRGIYHICQTQGFVMLC
jgi:hypothetical protein